MARRHGIDVLDVTEVDDLLGAVRDLTDGRGADSTIDAVGMEAHGSPAAAGAQKVAGLLPDALAAAGHREGGHRPARRAADGHPPRAARRHGVDLRRLRRCGGPHADDGLFDRQLTLRMGQANVRRWVDDILPLVSADDDPLGVLDLRTHRLPLEEAPEAYAMFQAKKDGCIKVVLDPAAPAR